MIEGVFRKKCERFCINPFLRVPGIDQISPSFFTLMACLSGIMILPLLAAGLPIHALLLLIFSGFLDVLDGCLARHSAKATTKGAAFDILSDRVVECAIVLGLYCVNPAGRALPSLLMLTSILLCVTSFLLVGIFTANHSQKSFHYSPGIIERAEAFIFFGAMMLIPSLFSPLAYLFSALVLLTAAIRMVQFFYFK